MYDPVNEVYVVVAPLPGCVRGLIKAVPDGEVILINEALSDEQKQEALEHELRHLKQGDLYNDRVKAS